MAAASVPLLSTAAEAAVTPYEAESAANTLTGTATITSCPSCSGDKEIRLLGGGTDSVTFNGLATVPNALVTIFYTNGGTISRDASIAVDGAAAVVYSFPNTDGWNAPSSITVPMHLAAAKNTVTITNTTKGAALVALHIDRILVEDATATPNSYEAEAAGNKLGGTAAAQACATCSGGQKITVDGNSAGSLTFNNIKAPSAPLARITVFYTNGGKADRFGAISVNGAAPVSFKFVDTAGWSHVGSISFDRRLTGNANTPSITNITKGLALVSLHIDRILVEPTAPKAA
jgi:alpha-galactosidase